jgi:hypothetical protein
VWPLAAPASQSGPLRLSSDSTGGGEQPDDGGDQDQEEDGFDQGAEQDGHDDDEGGDDEVSEHERKLYPVWPGSAAPARSATSAAERAALLAGRRPR